MELSKLFIEMSLVPAYSFEEQEQAFASALHLNYCSSPACESFSYFYGPEGGGA